MTLNEKWKKREELPGSAYLLKDSKQLHDALKSVSVVLHDSGLDLYSYAKDYEMSSHETVQYKETVIRCSIEEIRSVAFGSVFVVVLEAGIKTIFICFTDREERDACFTKILASVGEFLVLNPRSRKRLLGKRSSNPLSPVSPFSISNGLSLKEGQLSLLLNALDISNISSKCLSAQTRKANLPFSLRFPCLLLSLCNAKHRRNRNATSTKKTVSRSYTHPCSKYGISCKQFSARNSIFAEESPNKRSSLETRVALGILNTDLGDVRQYLAKF